jgi:hypothetical protein
MATERSMSPRHYIWPDSFPETHRSFFRAQTQARAALIYRSADIAVKNLRLATSWERAPGSIRRSVRRRDKVKVIGKTSGQGKA